MITEDDIKWTVKRIPIPGMRRSDWQVNAHMLDPKYDKASVHICETGALRAAKARIVQRFNEMYPGQSDTIGLTDPGLVYGESWLRRSIATSPHNEIDYAEINRSLRDDEREPTVQPDGAVPYGGWLWHSFTWSKTPEGSNYWARINRRFQGMVRNISDIGPPSDIMPPASAINDREKLRTLIDWMDDPDNLNWQLAPEGTEFWGAIHNRLRSLL